MNGKFNYNRKIRKKIVFVITSLLLVLLILISSKNKELMSIGGNAIGTVTSPITKAVYYTTSKAGEMFKSVFGTRQLREEHRELISENKVLKDKISVMENVINKEKFLEEEYKAREESKFNMQKAFVSGKDPGNLFVRFQIDKGTLQGVNVGDIIVQGIMLDDNESVVEGLVGKVTNVGLNWSKVSSIVDENSSVSFVVSRTGETGILNGVGDKGLEGYMYKTESDVQKGDMIYTSGLGEVFPRDIYIGKVKEVIYDKNDLVKNIIVETPVDFSKMYRVLIINNKDIEKVEEERKNNKAEEKNTKKILEDNKKTKTEEKEKTEKIENTKTEDKKNSKSENLKSTEKEKEKTDNKKTDRNIKDDKKNSTEKTNTKEKNNTNTTKKETKNE